MMAKEVKNIDYAKSHDIVRLSAKRYEQSPYLSKYMIENAVFGLYANRFYPLALGGDPISEYWNLRRQAMLYDVPEKPLEIKGTDAIELLEKLFTRKISSLKHWRARYAIACTPQGGILMDGVLIRLADDHFWYVQADGEFEQWLIAHSAGLDVTIRDPKSWVLQIQGPNAMKILEAASGESVSDFGYFHARQFDFGGQEVLITRTGWTGEMGFEVYSNSHIDHLTLWDYIIDKGAPFGLEFGSLESMGIRRIEAGILDNGTDIDTSMTPFEAGLGMFVNFKKDDFVGRSVLEKASQTQLLFGLTCASGIPQSACEVLKGDRLVGRMTTGGWSPTLEKGIGYVRFSGPLESAISWLGEQVTLVDRDGKSHPAEVVNLPFYDPEKKIPRGMAS
ncbi:MAG: aminomethyltransferase family protein [Chloroflexota bacterium]